MDLRPTTCRSCGATIMFAITERGRRMPLDTDPAPDGPWTVDADGHLERATADTPPSLRRQVHWQSCPSASRHRNRGAR